MANTLAIAAVSRTILSLIEQHCPRELLISPKFELYTTAQLDKPMAEGVSLCLYRVVLNAMGRNLPPRRTSDGLCWRPSMPVDLHFLITPWASDGERQQRLIGWLLRFLEDTSVLPAGLLNSVMSEPDIFRDDEVAEIVLDSLPLADYLGLWDKFTPQWQTPLTYVVRMVELDSTLSVDEAARVQTRDFGFGVRT